MLKHLSWLHLLPVLGCIQPQDQDEGVGVVAVANREIINRDLRESCTCRNEVGIEATPLKSGQVQWEEIWEAAALPSSRGAFASPDRVSPVAQGEGGCDRGG